MLIALLLLSVGLMGMAALHGRAIQYSIDGQDRTRAALLAGEVASRMWEELPKDIQCLTVPLSPTVITEWQAKVTNTAVSGLPNGIGAVAPETDSTNCLVAYKITITWRPPNRSTGDGNFKYVTRVALP